MIPTGQTIFGKYVTEMIFPGSVLLNLATLVINEHESTSWLRFENSCKQAIKKTWLSV